MTPYFIITFVLMACSADADLFPGGLFPGGLFPNGLFPNGLNNMNFPQVTIPPIPQITIPPIPAITIPPINIPPIPPITIPPIPMPKIPTAEEIANQKPGPGQDFNSVSINTVNGVTSVVVNKNGVVKKYEIDPNSPEGKKSRAAQSSSNNIVVSSSNPGGYYQQSSMTFVGGNGGGVANIIQNVDGAITHDFVNFEN